MIIFTLIKIICYHLLTNRSHRIWTSLCLSYLKKVIQQVKEFSTIKLDDINSNRSNKVNREQLPEPHLTLEIELNSNGTQSQQTTQDVDSKEPSLKRSLSSSFKQAIDVCKDNLTRAISIPQSSDLLMHETYQQNLLQTKIENKFLEMGYITALSISNFQSRYHPRWKFEHTNFQRNKKPANYQFTEPRELRKDCQFNTPESFRSDV